MLCCLLAKLCGATTLRGIEAWIGAHRRELNEALGQTWWKAPSPASLSILFRALDPQALDDALQSLGARAARSPQLCADGKCARGEGKMFFSIFDPQTEQALRRIPFGKGHEAKTFQEWLETGEAAQKMVSADAAHCQKKRLRSPAGKARG